MTEQLGDGNLEKLQQEDVSKHGSLRKKVDNKVAPEAGRGEPRRNVSQVTC